MKEKSVNLRTSEEDELNLRQAAENLSVLTDEKPNVSKAIRAGVKILAEQDSTKPILFYINRKALRDLEVNLEYGKNQLQSIIDEYSKAVRLTPALEEIQKWFGEYRSNYLVVNTSLIRESIVLKKYNEERTKCQNLGLSLQFTTDNIILPDLDALFEVCGQLIFIPEVDNHEMMFWDCYQIVSDKVEILPDKVEEVRQRYREYAVTNEEKVRLAVINKLCELLGTIKLSNPAQVNIPGFVQWDDEAGMYVPREGYIKGYIK